jgi:hypothetical protein
MSPLQYGTLKYIANHEVNIEYLHLIHQGTLGSLLVRGWIVRHGNMLVLTETGEHVLSGYNLAKPKYRTNENQELSPRVKEFLSIRRLKSIA